MDNKESYSENNIIRVRNLCKYYRIKNGFQKRVIIALNEVSIDIERGEIFGIIGPDGSGKTTLFKILTTLLNFENGHAELSGIDILKDKQNIRKKIGYMPGKFSLYTDLTVEENLRFFATIYGTTVEENYTLIKEIYEQIAPFATRKAGALSGGMKQKLALCCALIHSPEILFLDEPTTGVDPVSRQELWQTLYRLRERGITVVVSTPFMDEAMKCNRIAFLYEGKVRGIDKPDIIINKFRDILRPGKINRKSITDNSSQIIKVDNLVKQFGNFTAVDHISFTVNKGEIFGFLGANGAGKTTAMRILCGLSKPTAGNVNIMGFNVATHSEEIKKKIGYMSQKFSLYDDLTVAENIKFFAGIYGIPKNNITSKKDSILADTGLTKESDTKVGNLPLGWKQRLAFSVAMIHNPEIVFLDEPTGGVDPLTRRQFWEVIYDAAYKGVTIFVTTHYMDEAEYCDRISMMVDGKIKAINSPEGLKKQYAAKDMDEVFRILARNAKTSV